MSADASRGAEVVGVSVAFLVTALLFTTTRFLTRLFLVRNFGPEDWTIGAATVLSLALTVCLNEQVRYGMGRHFSTIDPIDAKKALKPFWISIWIYNLSLTFTKISILFQYHRIIIYHKTRLAIWIMMGIVIACGLVTFFDSIFLCVPVSAFWSDNRSDSSCSNENIVWYSNAGINIALDIAIVVLPMHAIKTLEISKARKIGVMFLFALGGFVTLTSIIRLYTLHIIASSHDVTWDNVDAAVWSCLETNIGIVCACLPAVRPLFSYLRGHRTTHASHYRIPEEADTFEMPLSPAGSTHPRHPSHPNAFGNVLHNDRDGNSGPLYSPGKSSFLESASQSEA